ncbi:hypothetical protein SprV_0200835400 [Sparganum proliferum]
MQQTSRCNGGRLMKIENITLSIQPQRLIEDSERINGFSACPIDRGNQNGLKSFSYLSPKQAFRSSISANISMSSSASFPVARFFASQSETLEYDPLWRSAPNRLASEPSNASVCGEPGKSTFKITRYIAPTSALINQQSNSRISSRRIETQTHDKEEFNCTSAFSEPENWEFSTESQRRIEIPPSYLYRQVSVPVSDGPQNLTSPQNLHETAPLTSWPYRIPQTEFSYFQQMNRQADGSFCSIGVARPMHHYPRAVCRTLDISAPDRNPPSASENSSLLGRHSTTFHRQSTERTKNSRIPDGQLFAIPHHAVEVLSGAQHYQHCAVSMMSDSAQDSALTTSCSSSGIDLRSHTNSPISRPSSPVKEEASANDHNIRGGVKLKRTQQDDSASVEDKSLSIEKSIQLTPWSSLRQHKQQSSVLMHRRRELLREIAEEYSNLVKLMNEERMLTGCEPEGYSDAVQAYEEAMDEFEIVGMYNCQNLGHTEIKDSVKRTSYHLPMTTLSRITVGSLQNLNILNGDVKKEFKGRAGSVPRERLPPLDSAHNRIHGDSGPIRSPYGLDHRPRLRKWLSLRGLSGNLIMPASTAGTPSPRRSVFRRLNSDADLPAEQQQLKSSDVDDLIAWKELEVKTVENILAEHRCLSTDRNRPRRTRLAYNATAEENTAKLTCLLKELAELKTMKGSAVARKTETDIPHRGTETPKTQSSLPSAHASCVSVCQDADTLLTLPSLSTESSGTARPCAGIEMAKSNNVAPKSFEVCGEPPVSGVHVQSARTEDHSRRLTNRTINGNCAQNDGKTKSIFISGESSSSKMQLPIFSDGRKWEMQRSLDENEISCSLKLRTSDSWSIIHKSIPEQRENSNYNVEQKKTPKRNNPTRFTHFDSLERVSSSGEFSRVSHMDHGVFRSRTPLSCHQNLRSATSYQDFFPAQRISAQFARNSPVHSTSSFPETSPSTLRCSNRPNYPPAAKLQARNLSLSPEPLTCPERARELQMKHTGVSTGIASVINKLAWTANRDRLGHQPDQGNAACSFQAFRVAHKGPGVKQAQHVQGHTQLTIKRHLRCKLHFSGGR